MFVGQWYLVTDNRARRFADGNTNAFYTAISTRVAELRYLQPNEMTGNIPDQISLQDGMEELFQNVTMNFMSSRLFW